MQGEVYCCSARLKRTKAAYFCTASSFLAPSNTLIVSNWQHFCDEVTQSSVSLLLFPPEHLNTKAAPLPSPLLLPAHSHSAALSTCQSGTHMFCFFEVPGERWRQFYHYECFFENQWLMLHHNSFGSFEELVRRAGLQLVWMMWRLCSWESQIWRVQLCLDPRKFTEHMLIQSSETSSTFANAPVLRFTSVKTNTGILHLVRFLQMCWE